MKNLRPAVLSLIVLMAIFASACGANGHEPHDINEETDRCAVCKMAIANNRYATQIVTKDGQVFKFDDIGCMNQWMTDHGTDSVGAAYVRDYHSEKWIKMEDAYYVYDASFQTPMAYGVLSFADEADAQAFIREQGVGTLMSSDELADHSWERNREMMHGNHDHGDGHGHEGHHDATDAHEGESHGSSDAHEGESHGSTDVHEGESHGTSDAHEDETHGASATHDDHPHGENAHAGTVDGADATRGGHRSYANLLAVGGHADETAAHRQ